MTQEIDLYLRKSKITRARDKALTFRAQESRGRRWAEEHDYTVRKVWSDNLSAYSDTTRPEFDKAISALAADEVPALWSYALDRFSRKGAGSVLPLLDSGKRLIFDYERLDSAEPRDRKQIINRAEEAREYSELLSHRVLDTKAQQREEGAWLGAAPYGFEIDDPDTRKLKHGKTWSVILRIFRETAQGKSGRTISMGLTADKVPAANGGQWAGSSVHRIVQSPVYEGWQSVTLVKGGRSIAYRNGRGERVSVLAEGVEPVPPALVKAARLAVAGHSVVAPEYRSRKPKHLLTGLLTCDGCKGSGSAIHGRSYRCYRYTVGQPCPNPASVMRSLLEEYVYGEWLAAITAARVGDASPLMVAVAERWVALTKPEETTEHREALAAVKAADRALEQLAMDRRAGVYDGAMGRFFPRLVQEAEADLAAASERVAEFGGPVDLSIFDEPETLSGAWQAADDDLRRDLIRLAVDRVTITRGGRGRPFIGDERCLIKWAEPAPQ
ncbi:recombinase family protein [Streptomyces sp. NBC_01142]|uniref:recombinase family protein n=1 Tax=Streptomyces sp. NBC_01142 TaxID=2975865 RepID=UPI00224DFE80|nr:recombinase family protein [Streptomyces sp. NBC_01142]MCX4825110.1 recombinase family protein [Streptomyces sp. NBC_01142]